MNSAPEKKQPAQPPRQPQAPKQQQQQQPRPARSPLYPDEAGFSPAQRVAVGGILPAAAPIEYNLGRKTVQLTVRNTGDRPIQVGSHFHFFEVNRYLGFDREAIRFDPGDQKQVEVVAYSGKRRVIGFNGLVNGYTGDEDAPTYFPARLHALRKVRHAGFRSTSKQMPEADGQPNNQTQKQ